jgi:RNA polymerase sigma-70 factor (ECF subfamily)
VPEEAQIIKKCKRNSARAQRELYELYKVKWFMICLRYAQDKSEAEDMLQEGLISVFKDIRQYDPDKASFAAWSNKVMVNAALQYLRKWKRLRYNQDIEQYDAQLIDHEDVYGKIGARELNAMVQKLPDGYRTVFNLYVMEGYKHREIAEMLSISENTSKTQLLKAKNMLRDQLEKVFEY